MNKRILSLACAAALVSSVGAAIAEEAAGPVTLSGNVAFTTDYIWRGVSQTSEEPAIQGGLTLTHEAGIYAGIWGSNVDFGDDANLELDVSLGFAKEFENGVGIDVGIVHFDYPSESDYNTEEIYIGGSYSFFSAKANFNMDGNYNYYEAAAEFELPQEFALGFHVGYNDPEEGDSATDWKVGISKEFFGLGFELAYTDTNIDDVPEADGRAVFTVSKEF